MWLFSMGSKEDNQEADYSLEVQRGSRNWDEQGTCGFSCSFVFLPNANVHLIFHRTEMSLKNPVIDTGGISAHGSQGKLVVVVVLSVFVPQCIFCPSSLIFHFLGSRLSVTLKFWVFFFKIFGYSFCVQVYSETTIQCFKIA